MVPSWTETLLEAGIHVVGRTRFCVHPSERVRDIPVVGGTKDWDLEKLRDLAPDLVLLDREENPLSMAEACPFPVFDTHVDSLDALALEFARLGERFENEVLRRWSLDLHELLLHPPPVDWSTPPGLLESLPEKSADGAPLVYVIWKNPWMAVGPGTYIDSVLRFLGARMAPLPDGKYPEIQISSEDARHYLFSSEPFPFAKKKELLAGLPGHIVDGESYSWFGVRGLRFLQSLR